MFEDAIAGRAAITHSDAASYTLTTANAATDEARNMILNIGGALTAARNTVVPTASKLYVAKNATTGGFATTLKTTAGTGIAIPNGNTTLLFCDGTNVVDAVNYLSTLTVGSGLSVTAGQVLLGNGLVGTPSIAFASDTSTGLYRISASAIGKSLGGVLYEYFDTSGPSINASGTASGYRLGATAAVPDVVVARDAANTLALRNTTNAQIFRVYNTFTDASNYERGTVSWSSNDFILGTEAAGTGTVRNLNFAVGGTRRWQLAGSTGHFVAVADNTYDIGASGGTRPRSLYWGTQALGPDGSQANPAFSFASDVGAGMYRAGTNQLAFAGGTSGGFQFCNPTVGGIAVFSTGVLGFLPASNPLTAADVTLVRDGASSTLGLRNSTNAQTFRIYNTFTDASNYERGIASWSGGVFIVGTENAGTGSQRALRFRAGNTDAWQIQAAGHFIAVTDNSFDIGATGANRPRDFFLGRNAVIGGNITIGGASMVQNSQSAAYTTVAADANKHILHPTADNNARTFTIDSNANVAYTIGTCITFVNQINVVTIAITADTLTLAGAGTTGSRTLAANGIATAIKVAATSWVISGTGLT